MHLENCKGGATRPLGNHIIQLWHVLDYVRVAEATSFVQQPEGAPPPRQNNGKGPAAVHGFYMYTWCVASSSPGKVASRAGCCALAVGDRHS